MSAAQYSGPSRLLAFAKGTPPSWGPILLADGEFSEEVAVGGPDISDHEMPRPAEPGLQVFEGWVEVGPGEDPDVEIVGEWRRLDHFELCRLRYGLWPWPERVDETGATGVNPSEEPKP